jgi:hypothetical protein
MVPVTGIVTELVMRRSAHIYQEQLRWRKYATRTTIAYS